MTKAAAYNPLDILPGVMPTTDATESDIPCWVDALHIRFDPSTGRVRKLAGWTSNSFDYGNTISGTCRTLYSATINQKVYTILGTNSYLYGLIGSSLTNISPLKTTSTPAADSLATHYGALGANPLTTTNGSALVVVTDADAARYKVNDNYTLSGAATTNGIPDTEINAEHIIRAIGSGTVTIRTATSATSSGSGGGAGVVRADGLIQVTSVAHGMVDGDRVKIDDAVDAGGILAAEINLEFVIRNVATDTFDVMTDGTSTSAVTAAGGAATIYYKQIDAGNLNQGAGQGYGAGLYGIGLYGTALTSSTGETYPRIWFCDRFGDNMVMTAGQESGCYTWNGDTTVAPTLISGAPTDINYLFVSDNILVTFGHDVENKIFSSDLGDYTQWTASSTNQVFEDVIEGAGRFISHCPVDGYNLIYTETSTYTMKYLGGALVWQILPLDPSIGIISPMARISVNGIAYWMGQDNFYMFRGGKIEVMPSNFGKQSSILRYVFNNLNYGQRYKFFVWYNEKFDEVWFHYASSGSNECDRVARFNRKLMCWMPDELNRTAGEAPIVNLSNPRLVNVGTLYTHESGNDDDTLPMEFYATTKKNISGKDTALLTQIVPDSVQTGTINLNVKAYNYPQSANTTFNKNYSITATTERVPVTINGRYYSYTIGGEELGQSFLMGNWFQEPQQGATAP